ncbi:RiPP maturation radical SAM C-methyltransferase [Streptomyces sp. SID13031]|uniref:RiPP maturation radical SAM C-methyltransferase n=1 Tax=Streptomyces sp. SID13031 TaxID=2706046 RepID=UPI0013C6EE07|nr:RiPP maturation radical SAM C-methyltransferase [Streptomyces sp. SID13031]NEA30974.1 RiPP maturation radical SAM protein 1 [Streptomyces sp. SID13031]
MRTVLVSMPFMDVDRPSIQLGLLKAVAEQQGHDVRTLHANLDFAAQLGVELYRKLSEHRGRLIGDWLFSIEAFGNDAPDAAGALLTEYDFGYLADDAERLLRRIRDHEVPLFLDNLLETLSWKDIQVVGFSCTFQQSVASFALARRLKERYPEIVTVFGGANFDGEMGHELARSIDCIDYAVSGEGDTAFPALLHKLAEGEDLENVSSQPVMTRMADLPAPDYDEYFERSERLGIRAEDLWIPFESARGCWWGAKHHCTFCGLNGTTMQFRSKPAERVIAELAGQARRYQTSRFEAVDNIIDMAYLKDLFPALIDAGAGYELFYEVKANLSRAQLELLAKGGVRVLQPGLESLSSKVLRLMDKGVRAAQNVNLLRWAQYYGIQVEWNILWGFPGETGQDYADQAAVVPQLIHLRPPSSAARIWMERFSPLFSGPGRRSPESSYRHVYPADVDLGKVAYFFEYELPDALPDSAYDELRKSVSEWKTAWTADRLPTLRYWSSPGRLQIYDNRRPGHEGTYTFENTLADIYLACSDRPTTANAVRRKLDLPVEAVNEAFTGFADRGLMFLDEDLAVALALPDPGSDHSTPWRK